MKVATNVYIGVGPTRDDVYWKMSLRQIRNTDSPAWWARLCQPIECKEAASDLAR